MKSYLLIWLTCLLEFSLPRSLCAQEIQKDSLSSVAQKDLIDVVIKATKWEKKEKARETKKINFSLIPLAASNGGSGKVVVSSVNAAFYLGDPATTNLSNVYFIPYTNFSSRAGFIIRPTLWLSENTWNFIGELRIATNQLNTYGLGTNSSNEIESVVSFNHARTYLTANRLILGNFYSGIGYNLDHFYDIAETDTKDGSSSFSSYTTGTGESITSSGITFNLLRDSRKNSINPAKGFYTGLSYKICSPTLGSTSSWTSLYYDMRKYFSMNSEGHHILALWAIYWGTYGEVPYFNLPGTALDLYGRTGRGYLYGRYRGKQMLYAECEYRFDISSNGFWGGVVFANAQSYTEPVTNNFQYVRPAAGLGLRVKFNKKSDMNMTFDVAFGKDSFNWYINLGEFF